MDLQAMFETPPQLHRSASTESSSSSSDGEFRPFVCPVAGCFRRFKRKCTLADHSKTHTGERPFPCPEPTCGLSFTTSSNLSRHRRLHPWLKPEVCPIYGCGRSFSSDSKLQFHVKTHYKDVDERHQCRVDGCLKDFSSVGNLTRHRKRHHTGDGEQQAKRAFKQNPHRGSSPVSVAQFDRGYSTWTSPDITPDTRFYSVGADPSMATDEELLDALQCLF